MMCLNFLSIFLICLHATYAEWVELSGTFQDGQTGRIDVAMDTSTMIVVVHRPEHAGSYRQTSNLHVFHSHLVAIKDDEDKTCFVQTFNESYDEMKHRVDEAKLHHNIGAMKKVWIDSGNVPEFDSESVRTLFGAEIADYCRLYRVIFVDSNHSGLVGAENALPVRRRRFAKRLPRLPYSTHVIDSDDQDGGGLINVIRVC